MGWLSKIGGAFEDAIKGVGRGIDDLVHGDFSSFEDEIKGAGYVIDDTINYDLGGWDGLALGLGGTFFGMPAWMKYAKGALGWSPLVAGAVGGAGLGAATSAATGGDIGKGALLGGLGGGFTAGYNPAQTLFDITNKTGQAITNSAISGGLKSAIQGKNPLEGATSGAIGAGVGNYFSDLWNKWTVGDNLPTYSDPKFNASYPEGQSPLTMGGNVGDIRSYLNDGDAASVGFDTPQMTRDPNFQRQSLDILGNIADPTGGSTLPPALQKLGKFAGDNKGELAKLLYGYYNNERQQRGLRRQMGGLEGLFSTNSPYAQQLRAKLLADAAKRGTRANTAGRETQLMAALAERAAGLAPTLANMNTSLGTLRNQQFGNTYKSLKGLDYSSLQGLFGNGY